MQLSFFWNETFHLCLKLNEIKKSFAVFSILTNNAFLIAT